MKRIAFSMFFLSALIAQAPHSGVSAANPVPGAKYAADAAEQLSCRRAHMTDEIRLLAGHRLAGPAVTLRIVRDDKASRNAEGMAAIKVFEDAPEGSVIVAALDSEKDFAVFGATFAILAQSRKLTGFVVDGSVRSLAELKRMEFPTFARGAVPGSAGGHYRLDGANVTILCGGIEVNPGDYVVADEDGVAVAPKDRTQEVLSSALLMQHQDEVLLPLIEKYGSFTRATQELSASKQHP
jgi:regulator of RNase E activity RraA